MKQTLAISQFFSRVNKKSILIMDCLVTDIIYIIDEDGNTLMNAKLSSVRIDGCLHIPIHFLWIPILTGVYMV